MDSIQESIISSKLRIKRNHIRAHGDSIICVTPVESNKSSMYYVLQQLKSDLPKVVIKVITLHLYYEILKKKYFAFVTSYSN